jgi:hypothetical protein
VGPRAGLDTVVRGKIFSPLPGIEPRSPGRQARSQTLHSLSDPAHPIGNCRSKITEQNEVPVRYTGIHRPISSTAGNRKRTTFGGVLIRDVHTQLHEDQLTG